MMKNGSLSAFITFSIIKFSVKCSSSVIVTNSALQKYDRFNVATDALQIWLFSVSVWGLTALSSVRQMNTKETIPDSSKIHSVSSTKCLFCFAVTINWFLQYSLELVICCYLPIILLISFSWGYMFHCSQYYCF